MTASSSPTPQPSTSSSLAPLGIGIDTGGTFTDIVLFDLSAGAASSDAASSPGSYRRAGAIVRKVKTPTTHGDYTVCIAEAFRALAPSVEETARLKRVALSTTLATNTVAENKVHPTALIIEPGDIAIPPDLHPHMALLKSEVGFDATELVPVSEYEVVDKAAPLAGRVEAFAVSGYASTRNPDHEQKIAAILKREFRKPVVLGSELSQQFNFMQRATAAALNAGLLPVILEWLRAVKTILAQREIGCPLYIVKGDGSLMEEAEALERPVQTLFSGPAASLRGGTFLSGEDEAVVIDVGGTTTDIGRVKRGQGSLRRGGLLINHRQIAVDGLDIATFGLGGDSRFRVVGTGRYRFENQRVLPFCRAAHRFPELSLDALESELTDQWHFNDPDLVEMVGLDPDRMERQNGDVHGDVHGGKEDDTISESARVIVAALRGGARRVRALGREVNVPQFAREINELVRQRIVVRIGLTPTDLFCAEGKVQTREQTFSQSAAEHALALYARMLDATLEDFRAQLNDTARRQATAALASFLVAQGPPVVPGTNLMERLVNLQFNEPPETHLALDPGCPVVLVGAGAPVLFAAVPPAMGRRLKVHPDGDVANAVGAITSEFLLRDSVSIEPVKAGGVELYDHHGKTFFAELDEAMDHARSHLHAALHAHADSLGLSNLRYEINEDVLEDYADWSRRARKVLVIARVEATLTGMPR